MLNDRFYMGAQPAKPKNRLGEATAVKGLIIANVAIYLLGLIFVGFMGSEWLQSNFSLTADNIKSGYVWTIFTYAFLHGSLFHIAINMLVLFFIGTPVEMRIGTVKTLIIYFSAVFVGGLVWLLVDLLGGDNALLLGASGGVIGLFAAFCMLEEDRKLTFLLFFIIPISARPRVLLAFIAGFEMFAFLFYELPPYTSNSGIAFSAHLGGIATGTIAALILSGEVPFLKKWKARRKMGSAANYFYRVNILSDAELRTETNRILDKINIKGFSSLSEPEKEILSIAKDRLK